MYKILIRVRPIPTKKPTNPALGFFESNFDGYQFYKECGKVYQTDELTLAKEKYEQLLYTFPAKDLKLINDLDVIVIVNEDLPPTPVYVTSVNGKTGDVELWAEDVPCYTLPDPESK